MIFSNIRTVLQIYIQRIHSKTLKNAKARAVSVENDGAKAGGPPYFRAGVGDGNIYHKKVNKYLKNQYKKPDDYPLRLFFRKNKKFPTFWSPS